MKDLLTTMSPILVLILMGILIWTLIKDKKTTKIIILTGIISLITLFSVTTLSLNYSKSETIDKNKILDEARKELAKEFPNRVYTPSKSNETNEFTKQSAIDSLTNILNLFYDKDNELSVKERFDKINEDKSKYKEYIKEEALNKLYIIDEYATEEFYTNSILTLLSFSSTLKGESKEDITPLAVNLDTIYFDDYTKSAYIPMTIYTGNGGSISFEMIYKDNEWKLAPYTLVESIILSNQLSEGE